MLDSLQEGLPAISLPSFMGLNSAYCNDVYSSMVYAQSVLALAKPKDILLCIILCVRQKRNIFLINNINIPQACRNGK